VDDIQEDNSSIGVAEDLGLSKHRDRRLFRFVCAIFSCSDNGGTTSTLLVVEVKDCDATEDDDVDV
jgi:hypothetical protein